MWVGALLNVLAAWVRYGASYTSQFYLLFAGQFLAAVAQLFILSGFACFNITVTVSNGFLVVPAVISGVWFGVNERSTSTAIAVLANQVSGFQLSLFSL